MLVAADDVASRGPGGVTRILSSIIVRLGGAAAIVSGAVWVAFWSVGGLVERLLRALGVLRENMFYADNIVFDTLLVGAISAIVALHVLQRRRYGWVGTMAAFSTFVGLVILFALESLLGLGMLLSSVGLAALGIVTIRAGGLPWWCGAALMAGSPAGSLGLYSFLSLFLSLFGWGAGDAIVAPVGIAWILVGYAVLRAPGREPIIQTRT